MDKKAKEKKVRQEFMRSTKQAARPIVEKRRAELAKRGKVLSREEENKIIEKVAKKRKREILTRGFFAAIGLSVGVGVGATGTKLLNEAQNKGITQGESTINIDVEKAEKDINVKASKESQKQIFYNGVRVDLNEQENEIKQNIKRDLEQLKTQEDVLGYIKNMYLQEYNRSNGTKYTEDDIKLYKDISDVNVYQDKAQNGDEILRSEYGSAGYEKGVYTIEIQSESGLQKQKIARDEDDKCVRVYTADETVEEYTENEASKLGEVIASGTDYAISMGKDNAISVDNTYSERLVNDIADYKNKKIERIVNGEYNTIDNDQTQTER